MTAPAGPGRRLAALAVAGVLAAAAGCGDESWGRSPVVQEQARGAIETWLGACSEEDGEAAVEVLTPRPRSSSSRHRASSRGASASPASGSLQTPTPSS